MIRVEWIIDNNYSYLRKSYPAAKAEPFVGAKAFSDILANFKTLPPLTAAMLKPLCFFRRTGTTYARARAVVLGFSLEAPPFIVGRPTRQIFLLFLPLHFYIRTRIS